MKYVDSTISVSLTHLFSLMYFLTSNNMLPQITHALQNKIICLNIRYAMRLKQIMKHLKVNKMPHIGEKYLYYEVIHNIHQHIVVQNFDYCGGKKKKDPMNSHLNLLISTSIDVPNTKCIGSFIASQNFIFCFICQSLKSIINSFCLRLIKAGQYLLRNYCQ